MAKHLYKHRRMGFRESLIMFFSIITLVITVVTVTFAWFSSEDSGDNSKVFALFEIEYTANLPSATLLPNTVYPNIENTEDCSTTITGKADTSDAYVRVKVVCTVDDVVTTDIIEPLVTMVDTGSGDVLWVRNNADGYYYYVGYINDTIEILFNSGYRTLDYTPDRDMGEITVKVYVEAIQREYQAYLSEWTTAPSEWKTLIAEYDITKTNEWD